METHTPRAVERALSELEEIEARVHTLLAAAREAAAVGERRCPWCKGWFPPSSFTAAAHREYAKPPCNACYLSAYPRRITKCSACGERIDTNGHAKHPTHRRCRAGPT